MPIMPHFPTNEHKRRKGADSFWLPVVAYEMRYGFLKRKRVIIPYVAPHAFFDKEQAGLYFKTFIEKLIKENSIPRNALLNDNSINENIIRTYIKLVKVANLEQEKMFKEGRFDKDWITDDQIG